jgi:hypothetical protein
MDSVPPLVRTIINLGDEPRAHVLKGAGLEGSPRGDTIQRRAQSRCATYKRSTRVGMNIYCRIPLQERTRLINKRAFGSNPKGASSEGKSRGPAAKAPAAASAPTPPINTHLRLINPHSLRANPAVKHKMA